MPKAATQVVRVSPRKKGPPIQSLIPKKKVRIANKTSISSESKETEDSTITNTNTIETQSKPMAILPKANIKVPKLNNIGGLKRLISHFDNENIADQSPSEDSDEDGDDISMGSYRLHDYFITLKVQMDASPDYLSNLRNKYIFLVKILQEVDETLILKGVNINKGTISLKDPELLPKKNIGINKYFHTTSKAPKPDKNGGKGMIWATAYIGTEETFDDLSSAAQYDLEAEGIMMMKKRLQCFKSVTPAYFQFLDNRADPEDIRRQIEDDIGESWSWILFNRKPWEGYNAKKETSKRNEFLAKCLHVECTEHDSEELISTIRKWIKSGNASRRFGTHIKLVEELKPNTPIQQIDRTVRINGHGRRFQASVDMIELTGLLNPNGRIHTDNDIDTVREQIISRTTPEGEPIFLAVTKKWGSSLWHATYIKQHKELAQDFAFCPVAWLSHESETEDTLLYKHFSPDAVQEAKDSRWDEETQRVITRSEENANAEEEVIANISWLVDLDKLDNDSDGAISFQSGVHFNFAEEVSVKTTRLNTEEEPNSPIGISNSRPPQSILRSPSDSLTVNSDITTESRLKSLEAGLAQILKCVQRQPDTEQSPQETDQGTSTPVDMEQDLPVSLQEETGEHN